MAKEKEEIQGTERTSDIGWRAAETLAGGAIAVWGWFAGSWEAVGLGGGMAADALLNKGRALALIYRTMTNDPDEDLDLRS